MQKYSESYKEAIAILLKDKTLITSLNKEFKAEDNDTKLVITDEKSI